METSKLTHDTGGFVLLRLFSACHVPRIETDLGLSIMGLAMPEKQKRVREGLSERKAIYCLIGNSWKNVRWKNACLFFKE